MKSYEEFKIELKEKFGKEFPGNPEVVFRNVTKTNITREAFHIPADSCVIPTLYVDDLYEEYKETGDAEAVIKKYAHFYKVAMNSKPDVDYDSVIGNKNVIATLVNTEMNQELLENVPHRKFLDLSIVYRALLDTESDGMQSYVITNQLSEKMGMTEKDLYILAMEKTKELLPIKTVAYRDMLSELAKEMGIPAEDAEMMINAMKFPMYIITNEKKIHGASSIIYEEALSNLADKLESDLYVLPSSIHETIVVPSSEADPFMLANTVKAVNTESVDPSEKLSDNVYHYNRENNRITILNI